MAIKFNPGVGCVVMCDFNRGFQLPEMVKKRPAIILAPPISSRPGLCTVVSLSASAPQKVMLYHTEIEIPFPMPEPFSSQRVWVKGDMINAVGFQRLDLIRNGRDINGKRQYFTKLVGEDAMVKIRKCVLHGLGLSLLTKSL